MPGEAVVSSLWQDFLLLKQKADPEAVSVDAVAVITFLT